MKTRKKKNTENVSLNPAKSKKSQKSKTQKVYIVAGVCALAILTSAGVLGASIIIRANRIGANSHNLTLSQINDLDRRHITLKPVEEMLNHIEETYPNETFTYKNYEWISSREPERLTVSSRYGDVRVSRNLVNGKVVWNDDFIEAKTSSLYAQEIDSIIAEKHEGDTYIVRATAKPSGTPNGSEADILAIADAKCEVYVSHEVPISEFRDLARETSDAVSERAKGRIVKIEYGQVTREKLIEIANASRYYEGYQTYMTNKSAFEQR